MKITKIIKKRSHYLSVVLVAILLIIGMFFLRKFYFTPSTQPADELIDKQTVTNQQKTEVERFVTKYLQSIKDGDVYHSFNNALSEDGWQNLIDQCETIEVNKIKSYVRLLEEGRLQELWRQCAFFDQFNFEVKSVEPITDDRFVVKVLFTDLSGQVIGLSQYPEWVDGRPIEVRKEIFGEYRTDEWNFFRF